jgi:hypothetical protein
VRSRQQQTKTPRKRAAAANCTNSRCIRCSAACWGCLLGAHGTAAPGLTMQLPGLCMQPVAHAASLLAQPAAPPLQPSSAGAQHEGSARRRPCSNGRRPQPAVQETHPPALGSALWAACAPRAKREAPWCLACQASAQPPHSAPLPVVFLKGGCHSCGVKRQGAQMEEESQYERARSGTKTGVAAKENRARAGARQASIAHARRVVTAVTAPPSPRGSCRHCSNHAAFM